MNFYFKKLEKEKESAKNRHDMNARGVERFSNTFEDKGRRPHALRGPGARARARALSTRRFSRVPAFCMAFCISRADSPLPEPPSFCALPYDKT